MAAAGLEPAGVVRWGGAVPLDSPGVYVVALSKDPHSPAGARRDAPVDHRALERLLVLRPGLRLDGRPPSTGQLADRLRAFWLSPEVVLYIGLAGGSVRTRVRQYYSTPLGAKRPHAGGWWLKTLSVLDQLWVHWGQTPDYEDAEREMLAAFAAGVPSAARMALHDPDRVAPFANLRTHSGAIKAHGIVGATGDVAGSRAASVAPRGSAAPGRASSSSRPEGTSSADPSRAPSQRVTAKDLEAGRVRLPRAAKRLFPSERTYETVLVRGQELRARWDPRSGPNQERSGVLAFGKGALDDIVAIDEVLTVRRLGDGRFGLE
jgi:hypothetical protein